MYTWLPIILLVVIIIYANLPKDRPRASEKALKIYHYKRKEYLMNKSEHELFDVLQNIYGPKYYIFPQVHLSTVLDHQVKNGQSWKGALSHINMKSVDFIVCEKLKISPIVAIELDGSSHDRDDRKNRDAEVDRMFSEANLALVHITRNEALDKSIVEEKLSPFLSPWSGVSYS